MLGLGETPPALLVGRRTIDAVRDTHAEPSDSGQHRIIFDPDSERIARAASASIEDPMLDDGGDPACWAGLVCQGCGGVITDPAHDLQHRAWLAALQRE
jgi:hypothetical protein